jgi:hypothetical protein
MPHANVFFQPKFNGKPDTDFNNDGCVISRSNEAWAAGIGPVERPTL